MEFIEIKTTLKFKCGDINYNTSGDLSFTCTSCNVEVNSIVEFSEHLIIHFGGVSLPHIKQEEVEDDAIPSSPIYFPEPVELERESIKTEEFSNSATHLVKKSQKTLTPKYKDVNKIISKKMKPIKKNRESSKKYMEPNVKSRAASVFGPKSIEILNCSSGQCYFCDENFSNIEQKRVHHNEIHGRKPFKCTFCHKMFSTRRIYQLHTRRKHTDGILKPYQCDICQKFYSDIYYLMAHMKKHANVRVYKCSICPLSYFSSRELYDHTSQAHNQNLDKFNMCELCGKTYKWAAGLVVHMRKHRNEKPFECTHCKKKFLQRHYLQ